MNKLVFILTIALLTLCGCESTEPNYYFYSATLLTGDTETHRLYSLLKVRYDLTPHDAFEEMKKHIEEDMREQKATSYQVTTFNKVE